jgi:hypothetical protein
LSKISDVEFRIYFTPFVIPIVQRGIFFDMYPKEAGEEDVSLRLPAAGRFNMTTKFPKSVFRLPTSITQIRTILYI